MNFHVFFALFDSLIDRGSSSRRFELLVMLVISRKRNQKLVIADELEITILEIGRNRVRFGIKAPKHVQIQTHLKTDAVKAQYRPEDFEEQTVALGDAPLKVSQRT